ncbi:MAG: hypothetical protein AB7O32_12435 [Vicinamibacterales bacterium]
MKRTPGLLELSFLAALALPFVACSPGPPAAADDGGTPVSAVLPAGDASKGRQVFVDLKCQTCHAVPSEPEFAAPFSANPGPPIDASVSKQDASYLLSSILTPAHELSPRMSEDVRSRLEGTLSPMGDYSSVMTLRQLIDLHAYLRTRQ